MVILGLADGLDAGAALVHGDEVRGVVRQAAVDGQPRSRAFPWDAAQAVLNQAGASRTDVDVIAVAGRFTPPFFVRRHPGIHAFTRDPFSSVHGANLFWQRVLRSSGLGALEADRARDWLEEKARGHALQSRRMVLVDVHKALAAATYRTQERDDALVVVVHPRGDGLLASVYRGRSGQLNRVHEVADMGALHVHLARCQSALELDPWTGEGALWALAGAGVPNLVLVDQLRQEVSYASGAVQGASAAGGSLDDLPWADLRQASRADAAASVQAHLSEVVQAVVEEALARFGTGEDAIAVAGAWMANPRLVASLAELPGVSAVHAAPLPGHASRALGAALDVAGAAPRRRSWVPTVGQAPPPEVVEALQEGHPVVRWAGPPIGARHGAGAATVLVRGSAARAVGRSLHAVGEPVVVARPGAYELAAPGAPPLGTAGLAAVAVTSWPPEMAGVVPRDQRVHLVEAQGGLAALLDAVGIPALVGWPAAIGDAPPHEAGLDRVMDAAGAHWIEEASGWRRR